ncbi:pyridoxal phosphate-dependent transferase [Cryomyces antarcticus]
MPVNKTVASSHILHRSLVHEPQNIVSGSGISFTLANGRKIIDASAGPAVSCLGHNQPEVVEAITKQLKEIAYIYSGSRYTCNAAEELASLLLEDKPGDLCKAIFVNSGSEATDAALKLVSQYWHEKGERQRVNFISRKQSYHGNTIGALSVSGHDSRRELYGQWLSQNVSFVDPCYAFRAKHHNETDGEYVERLRQQLDDEFLRLGPDTVAAFIAEPVSGTTLGCVPAVPGYFKAVREVCDKYGALLILDEIMCGMGKTGTEHAWQQEGSAPDVQTIGKALGGGFVPLSGVLLNRRVFDALANGSGILAHGHTFQAHPTACAGAVAVQKIIRRDNILANVRAMGLVLENELRTQLRGLPFVADIRGRGLFWAVEFLEDREKKLAFSPEKNFSNQIVDVAQELGLNILGNLGKTGEYDVELIIMSPPYVVNEVEIREIVRLAKAAIVEVSDRYLAKTAEARSRRHVVPPLERYTGETRAVL